MKSDSVKDPKKYEATKVESKLKKYHFDGDVQNDILRLMISDSVFSSASLRLLQPSYFDGYSRQLLCREIQEFQKTYSLPPTRGQLATQLSRMEGRGEIDAESVTHVVKLLNRLFAGGSLGSRDYTIHVVQEFAQHRAWEQAIYQALPLLDAGQYADVSEIMEHARSVGATSIDDGVYWYFEAAAERIRRRGTEDETTGIPTGIIELDSLLRRQFIGKGEVCVWLGPKGGGKSLAMGQMVRRAVFGGFKVIVFSFEMSDEQVADRQDAGFTGVSMWELEKEKEQLHELLGELSIRFPRSLAIKNFPTKQFTIDACDACLASLERNHGWRPDMIVLDYLSIVKPKRNRERHEEIQEIAEDFRGLCVKWNAVGHTANQINRGGAEKAISTGTDASGSWDQLASVDYVFTINQTPAEKLEKVVRIFADKVRDGLDKVVLGPLETDWERMIFVRRSNKTVLEVREERKRRAEESIASKMSKKELPVGKKKGS